MLCNSILTKYYYIIVFDRKCLSTFYYSDFSSYPTGSLHLLDLQEEISDSLTIFQLITISNVHMKGGHTWPTATSGGLAIYSQSMRIS